MKIAVTGGAGFLGYHLVQQLEGKDRNRVRLLDIVSLPEDDFEHPVEFLRCDVRNRRAVKAGLDGCDAVVHAAAALPLRKRKDIYSTNVDGTKNVLSVCRELGIRRVVHISSTVVYGMPEKHPLEEDNSLAFLSSRW